MDGKLWIFLIFFIIIYMYNIIPISMRESMKDSLVIKIGNNVGNVLVKIG